MMRVLTVLLIAIFCFANAVRAASPSLPFVFGDHAVIQRDMPVRVVFKPSEGGPPVAMFTPTGESG